MANLNVSVFVHSTEVNVERTSDCSFTIEGVRFYYFNVDPRKAILEALCDDLLEPETK